MTADWPNHPHTAQHPRPPKLWLVWVISLAAFAVMVYFATRHNGFPVYYHANSGGQAKEVITHRHNYRQPLLLVTVTELVDAVVDLDDDKQRIAEAGRWVAAVFAGFAVVALVWLGWEIRGMAGAVCVGAVTCLAHPLAYYAHFFKEDSALALGVCVALLLIQRFHRRRRTVDALLLGMGCGLAFAGKYVGLCMVPLALPVLLRPCADERLAGRWGRTGLALAGFAAVYLAANYPVVIHFGGFVEGLLYEIRHVGLGAKDTGEIATLRMRPFTTYLAWIGDELTPTVQCAVLAYAVFVIGTCRRRKLIEVMLIIFVAGFFLLVSQSTLQESRHLLPMWLVIHAMAGLMIAHVASIRHRPASLGLTLGLLGATVLLQARAVGSTNRLFTRMHQDLLRCWVVEHIPEDAVVAQDWNCGLPDPDHGKHHENARARIPQQVYTDIYAADIGTLAELRRRGVTHLAIDEARIRRVLDDSISRLGAEADRNAKRRAFYRELLERGQPVWTAPPSSQAPTRWRCLQDLRLYEMPPPEAANTGKAGNTDPP